MFIVSFVSPCYVGDWDLFFFPVSWEFLVGQYRLVDRCVRCLFVYSLYRFSHRLMLSPFLAFSVWFSCCFGVASLLDEDCNPGWGDCGRPLRLLLLVLLKMVNVRLRFVHWRLDY